SDHVGVLGGEPHDAAAVDGDGVGILRLRIGHFVFGDVAGPGVELADEAHVVAGEPDVAVLVLGEAVRTGLRRLERIFLDRAGLGIEAAELAGQLPGVPDRAVPGGERVVRARARRRHLPELDRGLGRAGDDDRGGARPLGKILDQILRQRLHLVLWHGDVGIEDHSHDSAPAPRRGGPPHAIDVMAGGAPNYGRSACRVRRGSPLAPAGRSPAPPRIAEPLRSRPRAVSSTWFSPRTVAQAYHNSFEASRAPSASEASFIHTILESTCSRPAKVPKPQSTPAMTFSAPTTRAYCTMRSATSSGCSTKFEVESITPGMMILPSGSFTSFQTFHSCPWRGLAPGNDSACGRPLSTMSTMSFSGTSLWWGPWVEAQQRCMRMRSGGMSLTAWLSASTWVVITLRNSSRLKWANTMWRLSARSGQSSCSTRPASTMARYSRAITSASA